MRVIRQSTWAALAAASLLTSRLAAQDLAARVRASDGIVNVVYPSRPSACGDGRNFIRNVLGSSRGIYYGDVWDSRDAVPCTHGPARAAATVLGGEVTRLRVYVGPVPTSPPDVRTIAATSGETVAWLSSLATGTSSRAAPDAIFALVLADAPDPWPLLLKIARDDDRPKNVRSAALMWLSQGAIDHLGIADADAHGSDDDEMRTQAVFVLSQRPKAESVPELIDLARATKYPAVRKAAIFWLGQTGDRRAADVYAELLGIR